MLYPVMVRTGKAPTNPFRFGGLALDEAFADREAEVQELKTDILNGQDVVVFAPRRFGKSSLIWRTMRELVGQDVHIAYVNLMTTPTREKLAERLAAAIYEQVASPLSRVRDRALAPFRGLRISPKVTVNPETGAYSFTFGVDHTATEIHATLERLLELPGELGGGRDEQVGLVFDEFQEIETIDPTLPKLMRSVFQEQPEVSHVYLGSRRHLMERLFNDENEPFWRSAKKVELRLIDPKHFRAFIRERFRASNKDIELDLVDALLARTAGHPYATQELCYFLWDRTPFDGIAGAAELDAALAAVLDSEDAHFQARWEAASPSQKLVLAALAREPGRPLTSAYRNRHELPAASTVQTALDVLRERELIGRTGRGSYEIVEPFFADWIQAFDRPPDEPGGGER
jgi:AAA+ ATPase superfamily predicted ATPase